MDVVKSVARNTFFLISGEVASKLISFLVSIVLVRYLGQVELGKYSLAMAYLFFFAAVPYFSHETVLAREMAVRSDEEAGRWLGAALLLRLILSFAGIVLALTGLCVINYSAEIRGLILVAALGMLVSFRNLFIAVFQKKMALGIYAAATTGMNLLAAGLTLLLIGLGARVIHFIWLNTALAFATGAVFFAMARARVPVRWSWEKKIWVSLLRHSFPVAGSHFFERILSRMDQLILFSLAGVAALGLYSATVTLTEAFLFIPGSLVVTLLPVLSGYFVEAPEKHRRLVELGAKALAAVALPAALGLSFFASELIGFVFGARYEDSAPILKILAWSLPLMFLLILMRHVLISAQRQKIILWGALAGAAANIPLNIVLIRAWGAPGAALATTVAYAFPLLCLLMEFESRGLFCNSLKGVAKIFPAALGMGFSCWLARDLFWIANLLMATSVYAALLILSRGVGRADWEILKRAVWVRHG